MEHLAETRFTSVGPHDGGLRRFLLVALFMRERVHISCPHDGGLRHT